MSTLNRREFLNRVAAGTAAMTIPTPGAGAVAQPETPAPSPAAPGLAEPAFRPLPLGSIRPAGWLERQLRLQADGLSGHLDEFWPDVGQSQWFGGKAEGWERAPIGSTASSRWPGCWTIPLSKPRHRDIST